MNNINEKMTAIADAIREKTGGTEPLTLDDMAVAIKGIEEGIDTSDATVSADEIFAGETAYTADGKVTGTFTIEEELTEQNDLISQISTLVASKANPQGGINTDDADATASDILSGKTAYVKGEKITGTIATKTSSNLTSSGATVTVPAGYYASQTTKSVTTATQATPSVSIDTNGKITASATQTAGYVTAGTKSGTKQLTTQAAKTITPTTSTQTAVAKNVYTTGAITVGAIPSNYIVPSGTKTITTNGTHDVKNYASATVNVASTGEDVTSETNTYTNKLTTLETAITALETELQGKASGGSGANFETCAVTMNIPVPCQYLGIDFQPKSETTSTFETIKNSIVYIGLGMVVGGSGYILLPSAYGHTTIRLTEAIVNIIISTASGAD